MRDLASELDAALAGYAARHSVEARTAEQFRELVAHGPTAFDRDHVPGHFTGSAWLVAADDRRVLLTHHRKLDRWLQPGGHADGDQDLGRVALREAQEESGLSDLALEPSIFDLDRHWIPARGEMPGHWHYDVRFVVRACGSHDFVVSDESHALQWRDVADIARDPQCDESMRRMARNWLNRKR
jgi:8-oxo-dGTP pyrophosphatase MutT (NUDIX family)